MRPVHRVTLYYFNNIYRNPNNWLFDVQVYVTCTYLGTYVYVVVRLLEYVLEYHGTRVRAPYGTRVRTRVHYSSTVPGRCMDTVHNGKRTCTCTRVLEYVL